MTDETLSDRGGVADRAPRYAGEDTRPTSLKELAGWYMYSFAAETYVICGVLSRVSCTAMTGFAIRTTRNIANS